MSHAPSLKMFQNVYRSTITDRGLSAITEGRCRLGLTDIVLSLNTHAEVSRAAIRRLLLAAPRLRVLELGGGGRTRFL